MSVEQNGFGTYEEIMKHVESFKNDAVDFYEKGNKTAGKRARQALDAIAKLKVKWRKEICRK